MIDYEFEMPWPPSVNVWKSPFRNRMILTKKGREYRALVDEACILLGIKEEAVSANLAVSMVLNPPTLRRYDIDNFTKSLFDGLTVRFRISNQTTQKKIVPSFDAAPSQQSF